MSEVVFELDRVLDLIRDESIPARTRLEEAMGQLDQIIEDDLISNDDVIDHLEDILHEIDARLDQIDATPDSSPDGASTDGDMVIVGALAALDSEIEAAIETDLDWIFDELSFPIDLLEEEALREAQIHRDWMAPRLVLALEDAVEAALRGDEYEGNVPAFALLLLAEFRDKAALPTILDALSLPDNLSSVLFDDMIFDALPRVFAAMIDDPALLDSIIRNSAVDAFVRLAASDALLYLIRDGHISREEGLTRLQRHLRDAIERGDREQATSVMTTLVDIGPTELRDDIRRAFELDLVDPVAVDWEEAERAMTEGEERWRSSREELGPTGILDTVDELQTLRDWGSGGGKYFPSTHWLQRMIETPEQENDELLWDDENEEDDQELFDDFRVDDFYEHGPPDADRPEGSEDILLGRVRPVGRNDPCPCGSGKKYKKCCGAPK